VTFHATGTISGTPGTLRPLMAAEDTALAELKGQGVVTRALLSTDRAQVFLTVEGEDEAAVRTQLGRLPLVEAGQLAFALRHVVDV
jgi:hypothetical protein